MAVTTQVQILVRTGSRAAARGWGPEWPRGARACSAPAGQRLDSQRRRAAYDDWHEARCRNIRAVATRSAAQRESLASSPFPSRAASLSGQVADVSLAGQKRYTVLLDTLATLPLHQVLIV